MDIFKAHTPLACTSDRICETPAPCRGFLYLVTVIGFNQEHRIRCAFSDGDNLYFLTFWESFTCVDYASRIC